MKKHIEIPLSHFTIYYHVKGERRQLMSMQEVEEWVFDWSINNDGGAYEIKLEDCYYDILEAYEYVSKSIGVPVHELRQSYQDQIEQDFRKALADSYICSYETEWVRSFYEHMQENISEALGNLYSKAYFVYVENGKTHKARVDAHYSELGYCHSAEVIRIYATKQDMAEYLRCEYTKYSWDEYANEVYDAITNDAQHVDTEHIDYYGAMGDSDDWLQYFKDYEESTSIIKEDLRKKLERTRGYIKNNVPLIYRVA